MAPREAQAPLVLRVAQRRDLVRGAAHGRDGRDAVGPAPRDLQTQRRVRARQAPHGVELGEVGRLVPQRVAEGREVAAPRAVDAALRVRDVADAPERAVRERLRLERAVFGAVAHGLLRGLDGRQAAVPRLPARLELAAGVERARRAPPERARLRPGRVAVVEEAPAVRREEAAQVRVRRRVLRRRRRRRHAGRRLLAAARVLEHARPRAGREAARVALVAVEIVHGAPLVLGQRRDGRRRRLEAVDAVPHGPRRLGRDERVDAARDVRDQSADPRAVGLDGRQGPRAVLGPLAHALRGHALRERVGPRVAVEDRARERRVQGPPAQRVEVVLEALERVALHVAVAPRLGRQGAVGARQRAAVVPEVEQRGRDGRGPDGRAVREAPARGRAVRRRARVGPPLGEAQLELRREVAQSALERAALARRPRDGQRVRRRPRHGVALAHLAVVVEQPEAPRLRERPRHDEGLEGHAPVRRVGAAVALRAVAAGLDGRAIVREDAELRRARARRPARRRPREDARGALRVQGPPGRPAEHDLRRLGAPARVRDEAPQRRPRRPDRAPDLDGDHLAAVRAAHVDDGARLRLLRVHAPPTPAPEAPRNDGRVIRMSRIFGDELRLWCGFLRAAGRVPRAARGPVELGVAAPGLRRTGTRR